MKYLLIIFWPLQILINTPIAIKEMIKGESFYAKSIGFFYIRQLRLLRNKDIFIKEAGELKLETFFYQSFSAIYICYKILGRRLYALISISILLLSYMFFLNSSALYISLIVVTSGVVYFLIIERGNYQIFPLILSICGIMSIDAFDLNILSVGLLFIAANFSVSVALLLSIFFFTNLLITFDIIYLYLLLCAVISFSINAIFNIVIISKKSLNTLDLIVAIKNVFNIIGVKPSSKSIKNDILSRPYTFKSAIFSIIPIFFVFPIFFLSNNSIFFFVITLIMFLNQSKLLRFFD